MRNLSTVYHPKVEKDKFSYPCLKKSTSGSIFLCTNDSTATCIHRPNTNGYCALGQTIRNDRRGFELLKRVKGSVTITD